MPLEVNENYKLIIRVFLDIFYVSVDSIFPYHFLSASEEMI